MGKKNSFLILNTIVIVIVLFVSNYLLYLFDSFSWVVIVLVIIICTGLYFILSHSLINDIFEIDNKLKQKIEKTMHEINTPVSTIQLNSNILSSKLKDSKNIERLNRIDKACENLLKLYEDMEYYIKKEIDKVEIVSFDLKKLVIYCIEKFDDIKIDIDIKPTLIITDKNGFEMVLTNLISNAIKHNKNSKNINIKFKDNILSIKDNGDGISTQDLYKIFDRYFKVDENSKGFGIGLNIVKEFCDKENIDIKIDSSKDGTSFNLNLKNIIDIYKN